MKSNTQPSEKKISNEWQRLCAKHSNIKQQKVNQQCDAEALSEVFRLPISEVTQLRKQAEDRVKAKEKQTRITKIRVIIGAIVLGMTAGILFLILTYNPNAPNAYFHDENETQLNTYQKEMIETGDLYMKKGVIHYKAAWECYKKAGAYYKAKYIAEAYRKQGQIYYDEANQFMNYYRTYYPKQSDIQ